MSRVYYSVVCGVRKVGLGLILACSASTSYVMSQEIDPEWPCIQRLVIEVSPAIMWPLPVDQAMYSRWRESEALRALAEQLGDLDAYTENEQKLVASFAATVPDADKEQQLSLLAVGVLDVSNGIRSRYIEGIKRYTRQQIAIAGQIENTLNQISQSDENADNTLQREELMATLTWHERIYDQREGAIRLLCNQPVEVEETLSAVLRDIAQYLP